MSVNASEQTVLLTASEVRIAALDLLARREHSAVELGTKLAKRFLCRESDPDLIEQVIRQLVSDGLLSDERFAVSRVRQLSGRGYGPARIRNELRRQQVDGLLSTIVSKRGAYWIQLDHGYHPGPRGSSDKHWRT